MTAVAEPTTPAPLTPSSSEVKAFASKLRNETVAVRVQHQKLGIRKALSREQLRTAAAEFDADSKVLTAAKKILDTKDPAFRAVIGVRRKATSFWKSMTVPYPEPSVRLLRKSSIEMFNQRLTELKTELATAAKDLQAKYSELRDKAGVDLGTLFNPSDYPTRVDTEFDLTWDFPSIEPPAYLKNLHPELYQQQCELIQARFAEAVSLAEQAFVGEFQKILAHLVERLRGDDDGKPKTFRDTAVQNLNAFFEQFSNLNVGSSESLAKLVEQAKQVVGGASPDDLRSNDDMRNRVAAGLDGIEKEIGALMVNKPKRAISLTDEEDDENANA